MVDASDIAIGGVLQQTVNNIVQPLAFFSRKLSLPETKYSTYDRELLAVYSSVRHFRHMLEGRPFTIFSDHKPLSFAFRQKADKCSPRQLRHLEFISQFSTDIRYVSGDQNCVADALSRISEISFPEPIDFEKMAEEQLLDSDLQKFFSDSSLQVKSFNISGHNSLLCDVSTGSVRPIVPSSMRKVVFNCLHNPSHPGIQATFKLISTRFVWPFLRKDCSAWVKSCLACQKSKIHRHTQAELGDFPLLSDRFRQIHIDLVGPLPSSRGYNYCLTCIDRYTRWPEAFPVSSTKADDVAFAFYSGWIARFGVPLSIATDQGRQFESSLFHSFSKLLGIHKIRTTAYHPSSNGIVERFHRQLKASIKCYASDDWVTALPSVLLGIRCSVKDDLHSSSAELVYGTPIRLPGEFFRTSSTDFRVPAFAFLQQLQNHIRTLRPVPATRHGRKATFVHNDLMSSTHVFVRQDAVRRPLQQPYDGPFSVSSKTDKFFVLLIKNKKVTVSIDRLKPAYFSLDSTVPEPSSSAPSSQPGVTTRYGRRVRFRLPVGSKYR